MSRFQIWISALCVLLIGSFLLNLMLGSVAIPIDEIISIIFGNESSKQTWNFIIKEFRLPKAYTAILAGMGLSLSGLLMQTLFRNPLAGPFVLGISNGASLGVALLVMSGSILFTGMLELGNWGLITAAILGSSAILAMVLAVSVKVKDSVSLLIIGLMVGSATGAIVSVLQYFSEAEVIQAYIIWTFGSLAGTSWEQLSILAPIVLFGIILAFTVQKQLNTFLLGEDYAKGLGISVQKYRTIIIIATCLLAGSITAFCGPIAFIGLAVPHIARAVLNSADHRRLIPSVLLIGAIIMLFCDMISQVPGKDTTLPINATTSLIGAPVVIWVVIRAKRLKSSI